MEERQEAPPVNEDPGDVADLDMEMTLGEHLSELRRRLLIAVLTVLFFTVIGFIFIGPIMDFLIAPAPSNVTSLYQFSPTEGIFTFMRVAIMVGVVGAMPMLIYQIGAYVLPGLTRRERCYLYLLVLTSTIAFLVGLAFCYFVLLPLALGVLIGAQSEQTESYVSVSLYVTFVTRMLLAYGLVLQTPTLICYFLAIGLVGTWRPSRWRPFAVVIVVTIAAVIMITILTGLAEQVRILS